VAVTERSSAFTLIELLVVVAVLAVVITAAVPSFARLAAGVRVRVEAQKLLMAVHLTRSEAIKRNRPVSLCPVLRSSSRTTCSRDYSQGWMVFENFNRDRKRDAGEGELATNAGLSHGVVVSNRKGNRRADELITYFGDGSSRRNLTLMVCAEDFPGVDSWSVVLNRIGRPRMARNWGVCPEEALPER